MIVWLKNFFSFKSNSVLEHRKYTTRYEDLCMQEDNMISALIGPVTGLLDKFIPDADEKARIAHELATMGERHAQELAKGQLEINKAEAASRNMFVAGWRPFIGWTCGIALFWHFVGLPMTIFFVSWFSVEIPTLPTFEMETLMTVLMGMLGLGGLRTFEKVKGKAK